MEFLLRYLDDVDDFVGLLALAAERIRCTVKGLLLMSVTLAMQSLGVMLALVQPPLALAVVSLLAVGLLYRAAVNHTTRPVTAAEAS
jgi:hypothetical protein